MSARKGCPFCGHLHPVVVWTGKKTYVQCPSCEARGPVFRRTEKTPQGIDRVCEATARWDDRA